MNELERVEITERVEVLLMRVAVLRAGGASESKGEGVLHGWMVVEELLFSISHVSFAPVRSSVWFHLVETQLAQSVTHGLISLVLLNASFALIA